MKLTVPTLYGLEDFGESPILVMELVSGQTLRNRIAHRALPVAEALTIAKQVAEGSRPRMVRASSAGTSSRPGHTKRD